MTTLTTGAKAFLRDALKSCESFTDFMAVSPSLTEEALKYMINRETLSKERKPRRTVLKSLHRRLTRVRADREWADIEAYL